jgi:uncharacterized membrane protein (DUF106 family)
MFEALLAPVFSPLLRLPPVAAIGIIALVISLIIIIVYKYMTDQTLMKDIKHRQKELQKKMKEYKKEPEKMMKVQKELMDLNMKYMTQSFKPTIITFLPIIIIFGWLNANLAYEPILPGQEFTTTLALKEGFNGNVSITVPEGVEVIGDSVTEINEGKAEFKLKGKEGDYLLVFNYDDKQYNKELTITKDRRYAAVQKLLKDEPVSAITLSNPKLLAVNLFGKEEGGFFSGRVGWLGTYIIFSLLFSLGLRKVLNIY